MFSLDDVHFLENFASMQDDPVDAIIVHKGIHDAMDYTQIHGDNNYPEHKFLEEVGVRANELAKLLKALFPGTQLLWRDAFINMLDPNFERISSKVRELTTPIFASEGFTIVPGYNVTATSPIPATDGIHPVK